VTRQPRLIRHQRSARLGAPPLGLIAGAVYAAITPPLLASPAISLPTIRSRVRA
jgi:hypothetical protein